MPDPNDHVRGPWTAVISHRGDAFDSLSDALIELCPDEEVDISVRRGTAAPDDGYLPGSCESGDIAYELDGLYLSGDGEDPTTMAAARWIQAQAMAAGLNAAAPPAPALRQEAVAAVVSDALAPFATTPHGDLLLNHDRAGLIAVAALVQAGILPPLTADTTTLGEVTP